jgi:hypothetical protein
MSEQENVSEDSAPTETLEQLASQFQVPQAAPAYQPAAPTAPQPPKFESQEDAAEWQAKQLADVSSKLNLVTADLDAKKAQEHIETQEKAVNKAIESIKQHVDMPDEFVEGMLHVKYARDTNFRKIFDNRDQNPGAYQRALNVVAGDLKSKAQWQSDPQATENNRAMQELQKSANRAPTVDDSNKRYKELSAPDFDREWERLKRG